MTRAWEPLTPARQKFRNQEIRLLFARLIVNNRTMGARNIFYGPRVYTNATVSLPASADGNTGQVRRVCAHVTISPYTFLGDATVNLSAEVLEGTNGAVRLTMGQGPSLFGPRCDGPFVPFPELEALSAPR